MEQRNQMLRELRLNKKESMGVVSVNNSQIIRVFVLNVPKEKEGKRNQINEFTFFFHPLPQLLSRYCSPGEAFSRENQWSFKLEK